MFIKWFLKKERFIVKVIDWFVRLKDAIVEKTGYDWFFSRFEEETKGISLPEDPDGKLYRRLLRKEAKLSAFFDGDINITAIFLKCLALEIALFLFPSVTNFIHQQTPVIKIMITCLSCIIACAIVLVCNSINYIAKLKKLAITRILIKGLEDRDHPDPIIKTKVLLDLADSRSPDVTRDSIGEVPRM